MKVKEYKFGSPEYVKKKKKKKVDEILEKVQNKKRPRNGFPRKHGYLKVKRGRVSNKGIKEKKMPEKFACSFVKSFQIHEELAE